MNTTQRLLVHNIAPNTTPDTLRRVFGKYGNLTDVHVPRGVNSRGQNFAFVEFEQPTEASAAFDVLNNTTIDGFVIHCQYIEPRDQNNPRRREQREYQPHTAPVYPTHQAPVRAHIDYPDPPMAVAGKAMVPQPAPLQAAAPLNPAMEVTRYNTAAGGEFTIDTDGRLTRRQQMEEEQRTGRARSPASQNPLLVQSAIQIAINDNVLEDASNASKYKSGVMAYVKTHPHLVIDYSDI